MGSAQDAIGSRTSPRLERLLRRTRLFPEVSPALRRVLSHGLIAAPPVDPAVLEDEMPAIVNFRLAPLALAAIDPAQLDHPVARQIAEVRLAATSLTMRVEGLRKEALNLLAQADIPAVIIKGPSIARWYADPGHRPYRDLDLLVALDRFDEARRVFEQAGFTSQDPPEPRRFVASLCREAENLVRGDMAAIDLHRVIAPWQWGSRLGFRRVRAQREDELTGLNHSFLIAALHVVSDGNKAGRFLMAWRDVAELSRRVDPAAIAAEARALRLDWFLELVLRSMPPGLAEPAVVQAVSGGQPNRYDVVRLKALLPPGVGARKFATLFRLPAPRAAAYLSAYLVPDRVFLRHRYGIASYRRWYREVLGLTRRQEPSTKVDENIDTQQH